MALHIVHNQNGARVYSNGVEVDTDAEGHISIHQNRSDEETLEALVMDFETRAEALHQRMSDQENRYDPTNHAEIQAVLELLTQIRRVARDTNISPALRARVGSLEQNRNFQALNVDFRSVGLTSFYGVVPESLRAVTGESTLHANRDSPRLQAPQVRENLHRTIVSSLSEAREQLRLARSSTQEEERDQFLLNAVRLYHRAFMAEQCLTQSRPGMPDEYTSGEVRTTQASQIDELRSAILSFPQLKTYVRAYLLEYGRTDAFNGIFSARNQLGGVRLLFSAARRACSTGHSHEANIFFNLARGRLSDVQDLENNLSLPITRERLELGATLNSFERELLRTNTAVASAALDLEGEREILRRTLEGNPNFLDFCPELLVMMSPQTMDHYLNTHPDLISSLSQEYNQEMLGRIFVALAPEQQYLLLRRMDPSCLERLMNSYPISANLLVRLIHEPHFAQELINNFPFLHRCLRLEGHRPFHENLQQHPERNSLTETQQQEMWISILGQVQELDQNRSHRLPQEIFDRCDTYQRCWEYLNEAGLDYQIGTSNLHSLLLLAYNRHHLEQMGRERPIALITMTRDADWNNAFEHHQPLETLVDSNQFDVLYIPISNDEELHGALEEVVNRSGRKISKWINAGHGSSDSIAYGEEDDERSTYDTTDMVTQFSDLPDFFEPHAEIVHDACSNGEGGSNNPSNIVNREADLFRRRRHPITIHSVQVPSSSRIEVRTNRSLNVRYSDPDFTYTVTIP